MCRFIICFPNPKKVHLRVIPHQQRARARKLSPCCDMKEERCDVICSHLYLHHHPKCMEDEGTGVVIWQQMREDDEEEGLSLGCKLTQSETQEATISLKDIRMQMI